MMAEPALVETPTSGMTDLALPQLRIEDVRLEYEMPRGRKVLAIDRVSIDVGWRWMDFHFRETTNEADLTCSGPFLAVSVTF